MTQYRDDRLRTRRVAPPQYNYAPQANLRRRGSARRRYQARRQRGISTLRALFGWFVLGMISAVVFVVIITPLTIRYIMPVTWVDRLPPVLKCLHPNFCRNEILPTAAAPVDAESLFLVEPGGSAGEAVAAAPAGAGGTTTPTPTATDTPAGWVVSTVQATPTLIATQPPAAQVTPTAAALDFSAPRPTDVIRLSPTPGPTAAPVAVAQAASAENASALPPASHLLGFKLINQTWNNCGPATLAMGLNYWGVNDTQAKVASVVKPDPNDKNITPEQMVDYVLEETAGLGAVTRHAGDLALLKRLVVAGFPVIIETGFAPDGYDWMGHYRLIVGYSDANASFYIFDSFLGDGDGQGRIQTYEEVDELWQHFNRVYVVVYPQNQEAQVKSILGGDWDPAVNATNALRKAQIEAQMDRGNAFAWFNLGTAFVLNGQYEEAAIAYDEARNLGLPWRMLWYQFGPFEAYLNTGRLEDVIALARANDNNTKEVEETYYYWGLALAQRGDYDGAAAKFKQATTINRNFGPAYAAMQSLP